MSLWRLFWNRKFLAVTFTPLWDIQRTVKEEEEEDGFTESVPEGRTNRRNKGNVYADPLLSHALFLVQCTQG